jgi:hypothetical protein
MIMPSAALLRRIHNNDIEMESRCRPATKCGGRDKAKARMKGMVQFAIVFTQNIRQAMPKSASHTEL